MGDFKTSSRTSLPPRAFLKPAAGLPCKGYSFLSLFLIHIKKGEVASTPPLLNIYISIYYISADTCAATFLSVSSISGLRTPL